MTLISRPTRDPKLTRWWWRTLREWVYELVDPLWIAFRGENSDEIALANVTGINDVSASELAILDGLTVTNTELNKLSGLTADASDLNKADRTEVDGVAEASKNIVLDANKDILSKRYDINQSLLEAIAGKPYLWFDGSDDYASMGDVGDLDIGADDFSFFIEFKADSLSSGNNILFAKGGYGVSGGYFLHTQIDGSLSFIMERSDGMGLQLKTVNNVLETDTRYSVSVTCDRDNTTGLKMFVNGAEPSYAIQDNPTTMPDSIASSGFDFKIGRRSDLSERYFHGQIYKFIAFNRALSSDEVKSFSSGAFVDYVDVGASQLDLLTNGEDWTGASGSTPPNSWNDTGSGTAIYIIRDNTPVQNFGDDKALEFSASGGSKILYQSVAQVGKRYRISFVYRNLDGSSSSYVALGGDGNKVTLQNTGISGDGVLFEQELIADGTDLKFFVDTGDTLQIDHVQVVQIGCIAAYLPDGITNAQWQDTSGNELHGSVNGALPLNLPSSHVARHIKPEITGDTTLSNVIPKGYRVKSMVADVNGASSGMILNVGTSSGGSDVVNGQDISSNGLFDLTVVKNIFSLSAAQSLYVNDDGGTTWSGVSVDLYIEMERVK
ncbi:MAG: LamG domain-containing protein [Fidelibacterota bacterium]|nr:MAG: LamG domain-containing protein [Candidatus Neomarinimicrobiota bacterium]